jgi:hypothetical protein
MLSSQEEQEERRRTLQNDVRVREQQREQGSTYLAHTHSDLGGRYSAVGAQTIVGAQPITNYPAASAAHQIQLPDEPPLGCDNPALDPPDLKPSFALPEAQATSPTSEPFTAPLGDDLVGSFSGDQTTEETSSHLPASVGGSPTYRRY